MAEKTHTVCSAYCLTLLFELYRVVIFRLLTTTIVLGVLIVYISRVQPIEQKGFFLHIPRR
jgi:hypothetical protein